MQFYMSQKTQSKNSELLINFDKNYYFKDSLTEKLKKIIYKIPDENISLYEIVNLFGNDGLLIFSTLLSLIFLIPVSIPGFSTVFGLILFIIGLNHLINQRFFLPKSIKNKSLSAEKLRLNLNKGIKWVYLLEKISKPHRINLLVNNTIINKINGLMILLGSIFLMLPFGLMPFSNTLPALIILFFSIGILQKDGLLIILGYFSFLATCIYFGLFFSTIFLTYRHFLESIIS